MNWDQIDGNWRQFKGRVVESWGKFTGDRLDVIQGRREQLVGKVQEKYGICADEPANVKITRSSVANIRVFLLTDYLLF